MKVISRYSGIFLTISRIILTTIILLYGLAVPVNTLSAITTFSFHNILPILYQLIISLCISLPLIYAIWRIRSFSPLATKKTFLPAAIFLSLTFALLFNPFYNTELTSFNRTIGLATINDYSVSHVTTNFLIFIITFALSFYPSLSFTKIIHEKIENPEIKKFFTTFSIIAATALTTTALTFFFFTANTENALAGIASSTINLIVIAFIALSSYIFFHFDTKISFTNFRHLIISILLICYFTSIGFQSLSPLSIEIEFFAILFVLFTIKIISPKTKFLKTNYFSSLISSSYFIFACLPFITAFSLELLNILNQHNIIIAEPITFYRILLVLSLIVVFIVSIIASKSPRLIDYSTSPKFDGLVYLLIVLGLASLAYSIPLTATYGVDLFESANYSVLISDFLYFGKIPIVEHYGGHMLTNVPGGIIYAFLNHDLAGAIVSPYSIFINIVYYIIFYHLTRKVSDQDTAFLGVVFLPFLLNYFSYFGFGVLVILSIMHFFKAPKFRSALLVDLSVFLCVLYRLDLGVAFAIATVVAIPLYAYHTKSKVLKKFIIATIISVILAALLWGVLSIIKDINPIDTIKQFLAISASNQNWGYNTMGNTSTFIFSFFYPILPFFITGSLAYLIFTKQKSTISPNFYLILLVLGFSYIANFTRTIVRHNLVEFPGSSDTIIWTSVLYTTIYITAIKDKRSLFLPCLIGISSLFFIISGRTITSTTPYSVTEIANSKSKTLITSLRTYPDKKVNRVNIDEKTSNFINQSSAIILPFLNEGETFYDFTNHSFIYSAFAKADPTYPAQTPGHLSSLFSQEASISDLQLKNVPIVFMPGPTPSYLSISLDSIPNSLRYYQLAEYIYQNYTPLIGFEEGETWVKNDLIYTYTPLAKDIAKTSDFSLLKNRTFSAITYNLADLPLVWGEKDQAEASKNEVLATPTPTKADLFTINTNSLDKTSGNYLALTIDSPVDSTATISIGQDDKTSHASDDFIPSLSYNFNLYSGTHLYLIRLSHDPRWYFEDLNTIKLSTPAAQINILKGD